MTDTPTIVVAHRAGNSREALRDSEAVGVDMVEADVHLFRGALEVRHAKTIGPLPILWEKWHLVRPFSPRPRLEELLETAAPTTHWLLDLKGPDPRLSRLVRDRMSRLGRPYSVCARNWWLLRAFRRDPLARTIRSVAGPAQLRRLRRRGGHGGISIDHRLLDAAAITWLTARFSPVLAWGVTTRERLDALHRAGVRGFILEAPDLIRHAGEMRPRS
jgi:glycerophosphoryl diester phosphodiesterase